MEQSLELGPGCYLTHEENFQGTLIANWSESEVKDALCYVNLNKPIPKFKLTNKGGK